MISKVLVSALIDHIGVPVYFVRRESFEKRADVVLRELLNIELTGTAVCSIRSRARVRGTDLGKFGAGACVLELAINEPIQIARVLRECAEGVRKQPAGSMTLVDVSAFRREELLVLLRMLDRQRRLDAKVLMAYVPAKSYANDWLSRGVVECRPVVGFPGNHGPSEPDHLVLMMGFEFDRAQALIEFYEPARVSVGHGSSGHSISPQFFERNKRVFDMFLEYAAPAEIHRFEFPLEDPLGAAAAVEQVLDGAPGYNQIIAPLNNKMSVLGAGIVGIRRPEVQVCYAVPAEYNEAAYSTPADSVYVMDLAELLQPT